MSTCADRPCAPRRDRRAARVAAAAALAGLLAGCTPSGAEPAPPLATASSGPAPASAAPAPTGPGACAAATFDRLTPEQRHAQVLMIGVPAGGVSEAAREALASEPGGIILTDGESASVDDVNRVVTSAQATGGVEVPMLVAADQEGGQVQELEGPGFTTIPSAVAQGRAVDSLRADAQRWGTELRDVGVTVDLAPVADVVDPALGEDNAPVGSVDRGYGTDPDEVAPAVAAFSEGMLAAGVAPTLKHFPGLGAVRQNTDFAGGVVDTSTGPDDPTLASFRAGIEAGAPLVMMSSAVYERIDPDTRALFSAEVISGVLRERLGFDGVVMTDDVGAAEALADVPVAQRATRFLDAGGDLVLTIQPGDLAPMLAAIGERVSSDAGFAARVDEAARRVLTLKVEQGVLRC